jgi:hypothetical protein
VSQRTITRRIAAFDLEGGIRARRNLGVAYGQHVSLSASDEIETGLIRVEQVVAILDDDPDIDAALITATPGDQDGSPDLGNVLLKTWKSTGPGNTALIPATNFGTEINWIALGTL